VIFEQAPWRFRSAWGRTTQVAQASRSGGAGISACAGGAKACDPEGGAPFGE